MKNSRTENRIKAQDNANVNILGHPDVPVKCRIVDFSRSGMCITLDYEVEQGKIVKVDWYDHFLIGRVQRVTYHKGERRVALELLYCTKWRNDVLAFLAEKSPPAA